MHRSFPNAPTTCRNGPVHDELLWAKGGFLLLHKHVRILCILALAIGLSFGAAAAAPRLYNDPISRYTVTIPQGWAQNPVYPDADTVEFIKGSERFSIRLFRSTGADSSEEARIEASRIGIAVPKVTPNADGSVRLDFKNATRQGHLWVMKKDDRVVAFCHTAPASVRVPDAVAKWVCGYKATPGASLVPEARHWQTVQPVLHRDPRGKFSLSRPAFWVLTGLNATVGDRVYTTRFEELGGNGVVIVKVYPGVMGDLTKHMNGWIDSLAGDPQYGGLSKLQEPALITLGNVPVATGNVRFGPENSSWNLRLLLATHKGTNYSVMLQYRLEASASVDSRLWGLLKGLRF